MDMSDAGSPGAGGADRGHLSTERRNPASAALDAMSTEQVLAVMNGQDIDVPRVVRAAIVPLARLTDDLVERMQAGGRLVYVGAGTSGQLGVFDASGFEAAPGEVVALIAGGDAALRTGSGAHAEDAEGSRGELLRLGLGEADMLVGLSAGGTTPYVWGALGFAHDRGAATGLITCVTASGLKARRRLPTVPGRESVGQMPSASLPVAVDHVVELAVGPEVIAGATRLKAGTAMKLALNMISTAVMVRCGRTWGNLMVDFAMTSDKLRDRALRILSEQAGLDAQAGGALLEQAEGRLKVALVMAKLNVGVAEAESRLAEHGGRLRPLLGGPR